METLMPAPGSLDAQYNSCICPVMDNNHGKGCYFGDTSTPQYRINAECPLHGSVDYKPDDRNDDD